MSKGSLIICLILIVLLCISFGFLAMDFLTIQRDMETLLKNSSELEKLIESFENELIRKYPNFLGDQNILQGE